MRYASPGSFGSALQALCHANSAMRSAQDDGFVEILTKNILNELALMGGTRGSFRVQAFGAASLIVGVAFFFNRRLLGPAGALFLRAAGGANRECRNVL